MKKIISRLFISFLVSYTFIICFSFILAAIQTAGTEEILQVFHTEWLLNHALMNIKQFLLPAHLSAILFTFSFSKTRLNAGLPFQKYLSACFFVFFLFIILNTLYSELVFTNSIYNIQQIKANSKLGKNLMEKILQNEQQGNFDQAKSNIQLYLTLDSKNQEMNSKLSELILNENSSASSNIVLSDPNSTRKPPESLSQMIDAAKKYEAEQDYLLAHHYANKVQRISDPDKDLAYLEEANRIAARTWDKISQTRLSPEETSQLDLYTQKTAAFAALYAENNPIKSYYHFIELAEAYPNDLDIKRYLQEASAALKGYAFFLDEIEDVIHLNSLQNLLFINGNSSEKIEIILIDKLIPLHDIAYIIEAEILTFNPVDGLISHIYIPFGKIQNKVIIGQARDRENSAVFSSPSVMAGELAITDYYLFPLEITLENLYSLSFSESQLESLNILVLRQLQQVIKDRGYSLQVVHLILVQRIGAPFLYFILSFGAVIIGRRLKRRSISSGFSFILLPVVPFCVYFIVQFYNWVSSLITAIVVFSMGFWPSLLIMVGLSFAILIGLLIILALPASE